MINVSKIIATFFFAIGVAVASESFGGIGISFQKENDGIKIVDIIPNTPAAESNLQVSDRIIAIDGISLKGKSSEEAKLMLRGPKNKPIEVTYVNNGETYSTVLSRIQITVKPLKNIEDWYDGKEQFSTHEVKAFASSTENDKELLAVLKKGSVLQTEESTSADNLDGVYIEKAPKDAPKSNRSDITRPAANRTQTQHYRNINGEIVKKETKHSVKF